jgi:hypothetical protein
MKFSKILRVYRKSNLKFCLNCVQVDSISKLLNMNFIDLENEISKTGQKIFEKYPNLNEGLSRYLSWIGKKPNITPQGIANYIKNYKMKQIDLYNHFHSFDYSKYGPELHAANFTLNLQGSIRLHGSTRWIKPNAENRKNLPTENNSNFHIEGLDLSKILDLK